MAPSPPFEVTTKREELNEILVGFLYGVRNVYFQPDENVNMSYPAFLYEVDDQDVKYADNKAHQRTDRYQVTVIDRDPDVPARKKLEEMPYCTFARAYKAEGLSHRVYYLYF